MDTTFYQTATERISRETPPSGVQVYQRTRCPAIDDYLYRAPIPAPTTAG
jgi:hypothetical protein